jgi:2-oxoglutarate dehydrogenase N-terminus
MKLLMASQRRLALTQRQFQSVWKKPATAAFSTRAQEAETFLNGTSSLYAEQMYEMYLEDPHSVHDSWRQYFDNEQKGIGFDVNDYSQPTSIPGKRSIAVAGVRIVNGVDAFSVHWNMSHIHFFPWFPC